MKSQLESLNRIFAALFFCLVLLHSVSIAQPPSLTDSELKLVLDYQQQRIASIDKVVNSVVAIYDEDRGGGGSGVVITPSGITLTNHHVIIGAGVEGWGGMAGDKMYRWNLIGTDPGGDVSLIQMIPNTIDGKADDNFQFPFTPLGDSDAVQVGDWALAMGNPFILTEDQSPTVTLGIVSGVKRYQSGAGQNQLVYGNCIQVDSSINPGNSGGPLFNLSGEVIGINGRGSFQDRGRVNVGLGYAISSNQIKNFIPELLATKLVEHGTLDGTFSDRGGKVVCSTLSVDSPAAEAGLALGDEMLEFEGKPIKTANQFTNLICTLPEGWPARLKVRKPDGAELSMNVRLLGLPYAKPKSAGRKKGKEKKDPDSPPTEEEKQEQRKLEMVKLLSAKPGTVRNKSVNRKYVEEILGQWQRTFIGESKERCWKLEDTITQDDGSTGKITTWLCADGRFVVETQSLRWYFDGDDFFQLALDDPQQPEAEIITPVEAKLRFETLQAIAMSAGFKEPPFSAMGDILIDGADLSDGENAWRFVAADLDEDPFYFWITGTMYSVDDLQLRKCSADLDCQNGGVMLENWEAAPETFNGRPKLPLIRKKIQGLDEKVVATVSNDQITTISIEDFEKLIGEKFEQEEEALDQ